MSATNKTWVNNAAPSCEDVDLNGFKSENNNLIEGSSQSLNTGDNQQTQKAVATYAVSGQFFTGGGIADVYTLTVPSPRIAPHELQDGMFFRALMPADNTGACTINPFSIGVSNIKLRGGSANPRAGDISATAEAEFIYRVGYVELVNPQVSRASLGNDQTWQDLSGSRSFGVEYTNSTGRAICVKVTAEDDTPSGSINVLLTVDGLIVDHVRFEDDPAFTARATVGAIIPAGSVYEVTTGATDDLQYWVELR